MSSIVLDSCLLVVLVTKGKWVTLVWANWTIDNPIPCVITLGILCKIPLLSNWRFLDSASLFFVHSYQYIVCWTIKKALKKFGLRTWCTKNLSVIESYTICFQVVSLIFLSLEKNIDCYMVDLFFSFKETKIGFKLTKYFLT